jgi:U11/U12 small nuclear ribonucleoprotein SNRNP65
MALPTPPLPSEVPAPPPPPPQPSMAEKLHLADLSSDESEMESSDVRTCYPMSVLFNS